MRQTLHGVDAGRLERSCRRPADSIRFGPRAAGLERADVHIYGNGFEAHRHDTYTIGLTTGGVQMFRYRGTRQTSLPGELVILYPDETHDGVAGTEGGFSYRAIYIAPELILQAAGGRGLPFVAEPVQRVLPATRPMASVLADIGEPIDDLRSADAVVALSEALWVPQRMAPTPGGPDRRQGGHACSRLPRGSRTRADRGCHSGGDRWTRPIHDRPPLPQGLRDKPGPVPNPATLGAGAFGDRER
jgi:hypothetical protein